MHDHKIKNAHKTKKPLTVDEVKKSMRERVESITSFENFFEEGMFSCIDGRERNGIVGTPGGTAGQFLLMLAAFEKAQGETIQSDEVQPILERYLEKVPGFYLHTDAHAVGHLKEMFGEFNIHTGKGVNKDDILKALVNPKNIGCGHIRYMLLQGKENYRIRPELVEEFLKALYLLLWEDEKKIELAILGGEHEEGAVVTVVVDGDITPETKLPLIKPNTEDGQIFMYHPQVAGVLRERITKEAEYIFGQPIDKEKLKEALADISEAQLNATLSNLASGKPSFTAHFNHNGEFLHV